MKKTIFAIISVLLCISLCSCDRYIHSLKLENMPQKVEHFDFNGYDTLKVTLSETEYIVLNAEDDDVWEYENGTVWHGGSGQWIKDGSVTEIWFEETPQGNSLASYAGYAYRGFLIYVDDGSEQAAAMLISNAQAPELKYFSESGWEETSDEWSVPFSVTVETYTREK